MAVPRSVDEAGGYLTEPETEDESDVESLISAGPATEDYFQQRLHRQEPTVESSPAPAEAGSKARESAQHRASGATTAQSPFSSAAASPRSIAWTMPGPEVDAEGPPPTYESISRASAMPVSQQQEGSGRAVQHVLLPICLSMSIDDSASDTPREDGGDRDRNPNKPPTTPWVPGTSSCSPGAVDTEFSLEFERLQNFNFLELMENSAYFNGNMKGQIQVRPATTAQTADLKVSISYSTSPQWQVQSSNYVKTSDSLSLQLPSLETTGVPSSRQCIGVYVRMDVRSGLSLENWDLATGNLNVEVDDGLYDHSSDSAAASSLQMTGSSSFNAIHGNVNIGYWSSRRTEVETISGNIHGKYALRDLLSFKSQSGSVQVEVDPKHEDSNHPSAAEFLIHTSSGSVTASNPTAGDIPIRNYRTRIETVSGSVTGDFILGMLTSFHTQSGTVQATLLPIYDSTDASLLHTDTKSASQTLTILPPYAYPGDSFAKLHSDHKKYLRRNHQWQHQYPR
ncbi:hypothetical protein BST61_g5264 [Cercospora zeina]